MQDNNFIHSTNFLNPTAKWGLCDFVGENSIDIMSFIERSKAFVEEYKHILNIALSLFDGINFIENGINEDFFFWVLIERGYIAEFNAPTTDKPVVFQPCNFTQWNYQCEPTEIEIIPYYQNGISSADSITTEKFSDKDKFNIVYLNKSHIGFSNTFDYYARLYSMLNQLFINNVFSKSLQTILEGGAENAPEFKELVRQIFNQNGIAIIANDRGLNPADMLHNVSTNIEWLGDEIDKAKYNLRRDVLERLGVMHSPYEKKERLTNVEIQRQDFVPDLILQNMVNTINKYLKIGNEQFKLEKPLSVKLCDVGITALKEKLEVRENEYIEE